LPWPVYLYICVALTFNKDVNILKQLSLFPDDDLGMWQPGELEAYLSKNMIIRTHNVGFTNYDYTYDNKGRLLKYVLSDMNADTVRSTQTVSFTY
jgi:hypothetical protein